MTIIKTLIKPGWRMRCLWHRFQINSHPSFPPADVSRAYGTSLVELLLAMSLSLVVLASSYQLLKSYKANYKKQEQLIELQQNLRLSIDILSRDLQLAGYNPTGDAPVGFVTSFPFPYNDFVIDYTQTSSMVAFSYDENGDGDTNDDNEHVAYKLENGILKRYFAATTVLPADRWKELALNIDDLNFVFLDRTNQPTQTPADFRTVEIAVLGRSERQEHNYTNENDTYVNLQGTNLCQSCSNDRYRRRLTTKRVQLRNIEIWETIL